MRGQNFFDCPSPLQTPAYGGGIDAGFLSPFSRRHLQATIFDPQIISPISLLLLRSSPTAVLRTVWAIVVSAVEHVLRGRLRPHVGEKVFERIAPPITDPNASTAVIGIVRDVGIKTTIFHALPNRIDARTALPMRATALTNNLTATAATATTRQPATETAASHDGCVFAVASTTPIGVTSPVVGASQNYEFAESLSSQVYKPHALSLYPTGMRVITA